ncbi:hypothetical protein BJF79_34635 [Actinomadura sp. CNU-125]|uniref:hypothetical protein n=1 Tax=Actinomadura sp. CNU-125 TaxID=1904961 RepID=UPI00095D6A8F|nr:hypothetical protein [Actinomadura sp. CNU-125]OLT33468.1 hypothetical protein BJF79_34635 [Actinomadura sp. CNU-125]
MDDRRGDGRGRPAAAGARRAGDPLATPLFAAWLAGQYVLGPLAARADQSVALQWVEQTCNTLAQAAFAFAAWRLGTTTRTTERAET